MAVPDITKTGQVRFPGVRNEDLYKMSTNDLIKSVENSNNQANLNFAQRAANMPTGALAQLLEPEGLQDISPILKQTGYGDSMWDKNLISTEQLSDVNELRAQNQPAILKFASFIPKTIETAVVTTLLGLPNIIVGLGGTIANLNDPNKKGFWDVTAPMWNNPFSRAIDAVDKWADKALPSYQTAEYQNTPFWNPKHFLSANFVGEGIRQVGFIVGAFYSGNLATALFRGLKISDGIAKSIMSLNGAMAATKAGKINKAAALVKSAFSAENRVQTVTGALLSAMNEATVEALNNSDQYLQQNKALLDTQHQQRMMEIMASHKDDQQKQIEAKIETDAYNQSLEKLKESTLAQGGRTYLLNIPILTIDNLWAFGRGYAGGWTAARRMTKKIASEAGENLAGGAKKDLFRTLRRDMIEAREKGINIVKGPDGEYRSTMTPLKGKLRAWSIPYVEGQEEVLQQYATNISSEMEKEKVFDFYNASRDPDAAEKTVNSFKGFWKAAALTAGPTFGDPTTWEQFFGGAVMGVLGMPVFGKANTARSAYIGKGKFIGLAGGVRGTLADYNAQMKMNQDLANQMKLYTTPGTPQYDNLKNYASGAVHIEKQHELKDEAVKNGDHKAFNDSQYSEIVKMIDVFARAGRIEDLKFLAENNFKEGEDNPQSIAEETTQVNEKGETVGAFVDSHSNKESDEKIIEDVKKRNQKISEEIDNYKAARDLIELQSPVSLTDDEMTHLIWLKVSSDDSTKRADNLVDEIKKGKGFTGIYSNIKNVLQQLETDRASLKDNDENKSRIEVLDKEINSVKKDLDFISPFMESTSDKAYSKLVSSMYRVGDEELEKQSPEEAKHIEEKKAELLDISKQLKTENEELEKAKKEDKKSKKKETSNTSEVHTKKIEELTNKATAIQKELSDILTSQEAKKQNLGLDKLQDVIGLYGNAAQNKYKSYIDSIDEGALTDEVNKLTDAASLYKDSALFRKYFETYILNDTLLKSDMKSNNAKQDKKIASKAADKIVNKADKWTTVQEAVNNLYPNGDIFATDESDDVITRRKAANDKFQKKNPELFKKYQNSIQYAQQIANKLNERANEINNNPNAANNPNELQAVQNALLVLKEAVRQNPDFEKLSDPDIFTKTIYGLQNNADEITDNDEAGMLQDIRNSNSSSDPAESALALSTRAALTSAIEKVNRDRATTNPSVEVPNSSNNNPAPIVHDILNGKGLTKVKTAEDKVLEETNLKDKKPYIHNLIEDIKDKRITTESKTFLNDIKDNDKASYDKLITSLTNNGILNKDNKFLIDGVVKIVDKGSVIETKEGDITSTEESNNDIGEVTFTNKVIYDKLDKEKRDNKVGILMRSTRELILVSIGEDGGYVVEEDIKKAVALVPFDVVYPNYKQITDFIKSENGFNIVNSGKVQPETPIYFVIDKTKQVNFDTQNGHHTIYLAVKDKDGKTHIINSLKLTIKNDDRAQKQMDGVRKLLEDEYAEFVKNNPNENRFVSSHVTHVMRVFPSCMWFDIKNLQTSFKSLSDILTPDSSSHSKLGYSLDNIGSQFDRKVHFGFVGSRGEVIYDNPNLTISPFIEKTYLRHKGKPVLLIPSPTGYMYAILNKSHMRDLVTNRQVKDGKVYFTFKNNKDGNRTFIIGRVIDALNQMQASATSSDLRNSRGDIEAPIQVISELFNLNGVGINAIDKDGNWLENNDEKTQVAGIEIVDDEGKYKINFSDDNFGNKFLDYLYQKNIGVQFSRYTISSPELLRNLINDGVLWTSLHDINSTHGYDTGFDIYSIDPTTGKQLSKDESQTTIKTVYTNRQNSHTLVGGVYNVEYNGVKYKVEVASGEMYIHDEIGHIITDKELIDTLLNLVTNKSKEDGLSIPPDESYLDEVPINTYEDLEQTQSSVEQASIDALHPVSKEKESPTPPAKDNSKVVYFHTNIENKFMKAYEDDVEGTAIFKAHIAGDRGWYELVDDGPNGISRLQGRESNQYIISYKLNNCLFENATKFNMTERGIIEKVNDRWEVKEPLKGVFSSSDINRVEDAKLSSDGMAILGIKSEAKKESSSSSSIFDKVNISESQSLYMNEENTDDTPEAPKTRNRLIPYENIAYQHFVKIAQDSYVRQPVLKEKSYEKWNQVDEVKWFKKAFPNYDTDVAKMVVDRVIIAGQTVLNDKRYSKYSEYAWGQFVKGVIRIYKGAETGTLYHEAFHLVFNSIFTPEEINSTINRAEKLYGRGLLTTEIEEKLAEDFRDYMIRYKNYKSLKQESNIFKKILLQMKFFVDSVGKYSYRLFRMFRNIRRGNYGKREIHATEAIRNRLFYEGERDQYIKALKYWNAKLKNGNTYGSMEEATKAYKRVLRMFPQLEEHSLSKIPALYERYGMNTYRLYINKPKIESPRQNSERVRHDFINWWSHLNRDQRLSERMLEEQDLRDPDNFIHSYDNNWETLEPKLKAALVKKGFTEEKWNKATREEREQTFNCLNV